MPNMTDPMQGMISFQKAFLQDELDIQEGELDRSLYVHMDRPAEGVVRLTYVKFERKIVTAFVSFANVQPIDGIPCFQIGYAVPEVYRKQGRARAIIRSAIVEMQNGYARTPIKSFYIEAIIGANNKASQRVAEQTISITSQPVTDKYSSLPALQYLRKIEL